MKKVQLDVLEMMTKDGFFMGIVGIADIASGMELKSPLHSKQGRQLLPAGVVLTNKHINTFKVWGIIEADILGEGESEDSQKKLEDLPQEIVKQTMQHTRIRFQLADSKHPAVRNLAKLSLTRVANTLYAGNDWEKELKRPSLPKSEAGEPLKPLDLDVIIQDEIQLASLPEVFHQIITAVNDPKTSASHIAEIVSKDPSLSARLLRIVNSPFYGFAEKIDTLSRALALVGTDKLTNLALGISAISAFKDIDVDLFDMHLFWEHSIRCALASSWLASQSDGEREETYFLGGLLHDIGLLIMLKLHPAHAREALVRKKSGKLPGYMVEREVWGFDHAELGGRALREWKLPETLVSCVMHHHRPQVVKYEYAPSIIHVSDFAAKALDIRIQFSPIPPMRGGAWSALGLTHNVFAPMATQMDAQLEEIMGAFFSG